MSCKMASRIYLLCLLVSLLTVSYIECRGGSRGSSRGSSRGGSRGGWGSWGSSSHSWSKPSSSSSSHWGGSSSHSYPSSSSGLSGSSGSHSYPSSSSGLSGFGSTSYNKPSSSSGSSWSSGSHSYPSSSSGLSGSGYNSYNKPSSSSGSSWSSGTHSYPSSSSGLSGSGSSSYNKPSSGSGSHTYPSSGTGLSGSHSNSNNHYNRPTYNTNSGHYTPNVHYSVPSYYTAPQYVYIHEYRNSNSRYGDLLTGLSLYNLGRSQSHYHDHYYYDDYYRRRYDNPSSTSYRQENKPQDSANCVLKVKENGREEVLKIPCEIVSTFALGNKKAAPPQQTQVNKTVCTTTLATLNDTVSSVPEAAVTPGPTTSPNVTLNSSVVNKTSSVNKTEPYDLNALLSVVNNQQGSSLNDIYKTLESLNNINSAPVTGSNFTTNSSVSPVNSTVSNVTTALQNSTSDSVTRIVTTVNTTTVNVTVCTTNSSFVDPLTVQGPPVDPKNMQCVVEIHTREAFFSNDIDCSTLVKYAKLPEPKKDTGILPPREKLKSWLANPPWWMSMFIAV